MSARDISSEILESIRAIKRGEGRRIEVEEPEVRTVREKVGVSQIAFAALLGVSPRTLQDWEQGRRKPSGPARSLLRIAGKHPEVLTE
jgi:putative transcriptional regulator